jgi:CRISPR/Cas system-associated exonuclease Cas4 (RecB family)
MKIGMAVVSRIVTGEEPCLRKVLYEIERPLPVDARVIQYKMEHELLVAKTIEGLTGDIYVNEWVTRNVGGIQVNGKIDIVSIDNGITTIIEVKSGKEKESHHVQLWMYMSCYDGKRTKGELRYNDAKYRYREADIPLNLWNTIFERTRPLLNGNVVQVKGYHCRYCPFKQKCQNWVVVHYENEERGTKHL